MEYFEEIRYPVQQKNVLKNPGPHDYIYDCKAAYGYYKKKGKHRFLSIMKQKNIRAAIAGGSNLDYIKKALHSQCGYCFEYFGKSHYGNPCAVCSLFKKVNHVKCINLKQWNEMVLSYSIKEFADAHKRWCKRLGLWQKDWE